MVAPFCIGGARAKPGSVLFLSLYIEEFLQIYFSSSKNRYFVIIVIKPLFLSSIKGFLIVVISQSQIIIIITQHGYRRDPGFGMSGGVKKTPIYKDMNKTA